MAVGEFADGFIPVDLNRGKRVIVHPDNFLDLEKPGGTGGVRRAHGVIVADAKDGQLQTRTVADQLHVAGQGRVARVVKMTLLCLDKESRGTPAVTAVRHAARVGGGRHLDPAEGKLFRPAKIHGVRFIHPLLGEPLDDFPVGDQRGTGPLCNGGHIGQVVEMTVGHKNVVGGNLGHVDRGRFWVGRDKRIEEQVRAVHLDAETGVSVVGQFHSHISLQ